MQEHYKRHPKDTGNSSRKKYDSQRPRLLKSMRIFVAVYCIAALLCIAIFLLCAVFLEGGHFWSAGWIIGIVFVLLGIGMLCIMAVELRRSRDREKDAAKQTLSVGITEAGAFGQVGIITVDEKGIITWISSYLISSGFTGRDQPLKQVYPDLPGCAIVDTRSKQELPLFVFKHRAYKVWYSSYDSCYYLRNDTRLQAIKQASESEYPVIGFIQIDNYRELIATKTDVEWASDLVELRKILSSIENTYRVWIGQMSDSTFIMLGQVRNLRNMEQDGYILCHTIRERMGGGITVSVGIASGNVGTDILSHTANDALEVAISRGGDQMVIAPSGGNMIYVGENRDALPSNRHTYLTTWCRGLVTEIRNSDSVIIVPPKDCSFSDLGAVLGLFYLCRATAINTRWVYELDTLENRVRSATAHTSRKAIENGEAVSAQRAADLYTSGTLVLAVGAVRPENTAAPDLFQPGVRSVCFAVEKTKPERMGNPVLSSLPTNFSSTSEQVATLLEVSPVTVSMTSFTATLMYAGILEGTNNFTRSTTADTFNAAAFLQAHKADTGIANDLLKEQLEDFSKRADILSTTEQPFPGIVVCYDPDWRDELTTRKTLERAVDSSMSIADVKAAFAIARTEEETVTVVGSSDGSLEIRLVMELLSKDIGRKGRRCACTIQGNDVDKARMAVVSAIANQLGVRDPYAPRRRRRKAASGAATEATQITIDMPAIDESAPDGERGGEH